MPGNALAAIAETMNGFWTESPSDATLELLKHQGVAPSYGGAMDRVGAAYPFIVGRSNSKVTFDDQSAVYNAVATSLTAWITDERVQDDMIAYSSGNWQARVGANVLPDESGLISPVHRSPAFSSMGFGRVTLGREKFLEYSAERFARSVVDRMLYAHVEDDKLFARMTEREWIESRADSAYQRFINDLRLNEETEDHDQVIDALRAERASRADPGGAQPRRRPAPQRPEPARQVGRTRPHDVVGPTAQRVLARARATSCTATSSLGRCCSTSGSHEMPSHILHTDRPPHRRVRAARRDRDARPTRSHDEERGRRPRGRGAGSATDWVSGLRSLVSAELQAAPNQQSIRPDQDVVAHAIERLTQALGGRARRGCARARVRCSANCATTSSRRCGRTSMARSALCASG